MAQIFLGAVPGHRTHEQNDSDRVVSYFSGLGRDLYFCDRNGNFSPQAKVQALADAIRDMLYYLRPRVRRKVRREQNALNRINEKRQQHMSSSTTTIGSGLLDPLKVGSLQLPNRVIMAPLTRCRADEGRVPNVLMAEYYRQRAGWGE